ncbi:MAG: hypothetical protein EPO07_02915 [Verrucomicrobia bacterium]|nr:MAG: hypothetical protein EPO07_02915 [Verrucomicrobiota bacterium]
MHSLYPIIRRKRRPLIEEKAETLKTEMLKSADAAAEQTEIVEAPHAPVEPETSRDEATDN